MKVAIDVSPLESGHRVRGVGFYLTHLKEALQKNCSENTYVFFTKQSEIPSSVDLVHYPYFDPFISSLPSHFTKKTIVTVHDLTPILFPDHFPAGLKGKFRWQLQKYKLKHVEHIVTDSNAAKKDIVKLTGLPLEKVSVVYLAAGEQFRVLHNKEFNTKIRQQYHLPEKFVLYVGDVTWNKRVPLLLEAMKNLTIPLVMVGKAIVQTDFDETNPWNQDLVRVQQIIKGNKLIIPLGFVPTDDLVAIYNAADVFVWPSVYEGFGLPILEAMQSGCPVVVSKNGCMPEVAGDAGYYFDDSVAGLSDAIDTVFHSIQIKNELREKGLKQANKFSWKKTAEEMNEIYKASILGKK